MCSVVQGSRSVGVIWVRDRDLALVKHVQLYVDEDDDVQH